MNLCYGVTSSLLHFPNVSMPSWFGDKPNGKGVSYGFSPLSRVDVTLEISARTKSNPKITIMVATSTIIGTQRSISLLTSCYL